jgi:hypothetical protein
MSVSCDELLAEITDLEGQVSDLEAAINGGEIPPKYLPGARRLLASLLAQIRRLREEYEKNCGGPPPAAE